MAAVAPFVIAGRRPSLGLHPDLAIPSKVDVTYHQDCNSQYVLPNDSIEHVRLETQATLLSVLMHNRVLHAPVRDGPGVRTLDIGCGTGFVSSTMAKQFPQAECCGVDLSPVPYIRPREPNLRFFQGNVNTQGAAKWLPNDSGSHLPQDRELFDYVFSRLLIFGITDWPEYVQTQYNLLKHGGWAEMHDLDWDYFNEAEENISDQWPWLKTIYNVCEGQKGMNFHCGSKAAQWMRDAGFQDVQVVRYYWGFGGSLEPDPAIRAYSEFHVQGQANMLHTMIEKTMRGTATPETIAQVQRNMAYDLRLQLGKHMWFYVTIGRKPDA